MSKKSSSFFEELTDSYIIGAIALSIFKAIALIFKFIFYIITWPIAIFVKQKK